MMNTINSHSCIVVIFPLQSLEIVRNKNNAAELMLRRRLDAYDREKALSIMTIDHDRLDTKDFLKDLKICNSDDLPEARL